MAPSPRCCIYPKLILYLIWVSFTPQISMSVPFCQSNTLWTHERGGKIHLSGHPLGMRPGHGAWDCYKGMILELFGPCGLVLMWIGGWSRGLESCRTSPIGEIATGANRCLSGLLPGWYWWFWVFTGNGGELKEGIPKCRVEVLLAWGLRARQDYF